MGYRTRSEVGAGTGGADRGIGDTTGDRKLIGSGSARGTGEDDRVGLRVVGCRDTRGRKRTVLSDHRVASSCPVVPALIVIVPVLRLCLLSFRLLTLRVPESVSPALSRLRVTVLAGIAAEPEAAVVVVSEVTLVGVEPLTSLRLDTPVTVRASPAASPVIVSLLLVVLYAAVMPNPLNTVSAVMAAAASLPSISGPADRLTVDRDGRASAEGI